MIKMVKTTLKELFVNRKNCWGWAWACSNKKGKYLFQNDNDLGLMGEDLDFPVYITKKEKIARNGYLYFVTARVSQDGDGTEATIPQIKAMLKECHSHLCKLTSKDKLLIKRYNDGLEKQRIALYGS